MMQLFKDARFFPTVLIILDVCAAVRYGIAGDARRAIYWFAAGCLTTTVTW